MSPTTGESTIGITTRVPMVLQCTWPPAANRVAPTSPPKSACEDEEGSQKYQVRRFRTVDARDAEKSTARLFIPWGSVTSPEPTVVATLPPRNEPTRLPSAAMSSATRGVSARVETEVAMALAASWKPLV